MAASLGNAIVFIGANLDGLNKSLGDAERNIKRHAGNILKLGQTIGKGMTVIGGAIAGVAGLAVKAAADQQAAEAQLDAVLKSTAGAAGMTKDELTKLASEMQKLTTYGDEAVMGAESLLLTFTNIGKDVFPDATKTVLDMSTALGQDLKSSSVQLGKALQDPILGITALRRVGINFTESQRDQIKAMVEAGDVMGAQKLILAELATEFGGSAQAAAQTFAGRLEQVKNQAGDLMEQIGFVLMPILQNLLAYIQPIVQSLMDWITANQELTQKIVLWTAAIGGVSLVMGPVLMSLQSMITLLTILGGPAGAILLVVAAGTALTQMFSNLDDTNPGHNFISDTVKKFEWLQSKIESVIGWLVKAIDKFKEFFGLANKTGQLGEGSLRHLNDGSVTMEGHAIGGFLGRGLNIVGEKGREIIDGTTGRVYTNAQTESMLAGAHGGATINIPMTITFTKSPKDFSDSDVQALTNKLAAAVRKLGI